MENQVFNKKNLIIFLIIILLIVICFWAFVPKMMPKTPSTGIPSEIQSDIYNDMQANMQATLPHNMPSNMQFENFESENIQNNSQNDSNDEQLTVQPFGDEYFHNEGSLSSQVSQLHGQRHGQHYGQCCGQHGQYPGHIKHDGHFSKQYPGLHHGKRYGHNIHKGQLLGQGGQGIENCGLREQLYEDEQLYDLAKKEKLYDEQLYDLAKKEQLYEEQLIDKLEDKTLPLINPRVSSLADGPGYEVGPMDEANQSAFANIPSNYYFLDDGAGGEMSVINNLCSKSCCSEQWPLSFKMKHDPYVCQNKDKFVPSNMFCNNSFQDAGCLCLGRNQSKFLMTRGNNGVEFF